MILKMIAPFVTMQGAQLVFERFIVPFLKQYASHIDPIFKTTDQARFPFALRQHMYSMRGNLEQLLVVA